MNSRNSLQIRILSIVAFAACLAVFVLALHLIFTNLELVILYVAGLAGVLAGSWLMLTKRGLAWIAGVVLILVAVVLFVAATWIFLTKPENATRFALLVGLVAVYIALVSVTAHKYWKDRRLRARAGGGARGLAAVHRAVLIINPKSGDGRAVKAHIPDKARTMGISVVVLERGQDMVAIAREAVANGVDILGVSGGDGSLGAVASVAIEHDLPLVVLPGGTRCHFARDIGLDPARIADALEAFGGVERRVDVGLIGDRIFLNNASFGLYAETISKPEYRDHKLDTTLKVARELASSNKPYYPIKFHDNHGQAWDHAAQVLVGVNRYETLHLGELGQRNRLDEGILQIIAIRTADDQMVRHLARNLNVSSGSTGPISEWTATEFTISQAGGLMNVGVDGESLEMALAVRMKILPASLRLMVPPEGVRSRPIKPLSIKGAKTLLRLSKKE